MKPPIERSTPFRCVLGALALAKAAGVRLPRPLWGLTVL